jgi:hypothetical protein
MTDSPSRFERALSEFDRIHADDPARAVVDGREQPEELVYARRMSETLDWFAPNRSEELRLAVRAQHIARWQVPRSDYPMGRSGYKQWRAHLLVRQAELASGVLRDVGYGDATVARVSQLLRKQGLARDAEVQTLEDVACLVFLTYYFDDFAQGHDDDKLVDILRKTWAKMSDDGRRAALALNLQGRAAPLLTRALAEVGT